MSSFLRDKIAFAVVAALASVSCGGGHNAASPDGGPARDGGGAGTDGSRKVDGRARVDGPTGSDAPTGGDAGDPCAVVTSGVSSSTALTAVWANEGGDKVTQDELRASGHASAVVNSVWDGTCIKVFGAENEVVSFDVVLEAATSKASSVSVSLGNLTGPGGTVIRSVPRAAGKLFDWTTTEAELFYVRYLQITGLRGAPLRCSQRLRQSARA